MKTYEHDILKCSKQTKLCVSPNSQYVVVGTRDGHMVYIDLNDPGTNLDTVVRSQHPGPIIKVAW